MWAGAMMAKRSRFFRFAPAVPARVVVEQVDQALGGLCQSRTQSAHFMHGQSVCWRASVENWVIALWHKIRKATADAVKEAGRLSQCA